MGGDTAATIQPSGTPRIASTGIGTLMELEWPALSSISQLDT